MDRKNIFLSKAKLIHQDFYDYSLVEYTNMNTKVIIKCPLHGVFKQSPYKHINRKQGCPICGIEKSRIKRIKPFYIFLNQAIKIHGDNYDYSLSKIDYEGAFKKVRIICKKHGEWRQTPDNHINDKKGCYYCGLEKLSKHFSRTQDEFITLANNVHNNKYDYSEVIYKGADEKIKIICKKHGIWEQTAHSHLKGHNCPKCTGNIPLTKKEFVDRARNIHGDIYDYSLSNYINAHTKVLIKCKEYGVFKQTPTDHIHSNGKGCSKCVESVGERFIRLFLEKNNIEYIYQKKFDDCKFVKQLIFDFYLPKQNILIEYDGIQHFEPLSIFGGEKAFQKQLIKDDIKNVYCKDMSIKLLRINFDKLNHIEEILIDEIL